MPEAKTEETHAHRIKRLRMRSMRRGTKEMDILLTRFADRELETLDPDTLDLYDALLWENDQDLYQWVAGQVPPPPAYDALIARIQAASAAPAR